MSDKKTETDVTRSDVEAAYRIFLGRNAEKSSAVDNHLSKAKSLAQLRDTFLDSSEFKGKYQIQVLRDLEVDFRNRGPAQIDADLPSDKVSALAQHIKEVWSNLGEVEPHYSVLSADRFKPNQIDKTLQNFLQSGKDEADQLCAEMASLGIDPTSFNTCLEYGCGVGRVTRYLADIFPNVIGCDISKNHLDLAESYFAAEGKANGTFLEMADFPLSNLPAFDFLYSRIVLQHNPPPVITSVLRSLLGGLGKGGVAVFQVVTFIRGYSFSIDDYIKGMEALDNQELHAVPEETIFEIIQDSGCIPLHVYRDASVSSPSNISKRFVVRKR